MRFEPTGLEGAWLIVTEPCRDVRGAFGRIFCRDEFLAAGLTGTFVQQSLSFNNRAGTLRGLHFQWPPSREAKLIRCVRGAIFDAIVDLRPGSPTFLAHFTVELSEANLVSIYVPEGFAHGSQSLTEETALLYQMTDFYSAELAYRYRFDDAAFGVRWPRDVVDISERDRDAPPFDVARHVAEFRRRGSQPPDE